MGDRTTVTVHVLKEDFELAKSFFENHSETPSETHEADYSHLCGFVFYDVNYGELDCTDTLRDHAPFAFDYEWEAGCEYSSGHLKIRFTETGERRVISNFDDNQQCTLSTLVSLRDSNPTPEALAAALDGLIQKIEKQWVALPWDNQHEYAKLWRVQQLLE